MEGLLRLFFIFVFLLAGCASAGHKRGLSSLETKAVYADADAVFLRAQLLIYADRLKEARDFLAVQPVVKNNIDLSLMLARLELSFKNLDQAGDVYRSLYEKHPKNKEVLKAWGNFLNKSGDSAAAIEVYSALVKIYPDEPNHWILKGITSLEAGRLNESWASFQKLIKKKGKVKTIGFYYIGKLMQFAGDFEQSEVSFKECLRLDPLFVDCAKDWSDQKKILGDLKGARRVLVDFLQTYTEADVELFNKLSHLQIRLGQMQEAQKTLERAERSFGSDRQITRKLALVLSQQKDYSAARSRFKILFDNGSYTEADVVNYLNTFLMEKNTSGALQRAETFKTDPKMKFIFFLKRSEIWAVEKKSHKKFCEAVISSKAFCYKSLVRFYTNRNEPRKAISKLKYLIKKNPEDHLAHYIYGKSLYSLGKWKKAELKVKQALSLKKDFHPAQNFLAYYYASEGKNLKIAEEYISSALKMAPENGHYLDTYGYLLFKKGEYKKSLGYLLKASRLIPEQAEVYEHIGDVYAAMKQANQARRFYRLASQLFTSENQARLGGKIAKLSDLKIQRGLSSVVGDATTN